jgi:hypothetical protein
MRFFAQLVALARAAFGVAYFADPARIGRAWIGPRGAERPAHLLSRSIAARDVALGGGAVLAIRSGDGAGWLAANALCDAADLASTVALRDSLPESSARMTIALAGGSLIACAVCAVALARD